MAKLDIKRLRKQRAEIAQKNNRGNFWKTGKGTNEVRLMLWESKVTGKAEFFRPIDMHQQRGSPPVICGRSTTRDGRSSPDCPECEKYEAVLQEDGREAARAFKSKTRYVMLAVPLVKGDEKFKQRRVYPFWAAKMLGEQIISIVTDCDECESPDDYFGPNGLNFKITFDPDASPVSMYSVKVLPKKKSEVLDPALFKEYTDLYEDPACEPAWFLADLPDEEEAPEAPEADEDEDEDEDQEDSADDAEDSEDSEDDSDEDEDSEEEDSEEEDDAEVDEDGNPAPAEGMVISDGVWCFDTAEAAKAYLKATKQVRKWDVEKDDDGLYFFRLKSDDDVAQYAPPVKE